MRASPHRVDWPESYLLLRVEEESTTRALALSQELDDFDTSRLSKVGERVPSPVDSVDPALRGSRQATGISGECAVRTCWFHAAISGVDQGQRAKRFKGGAAPQAPKNPNTRAALFPSRPRWLFEGGLR